MVPRSRLLGLRRLAVCAVLAAAAALAPPAAQASAPPAPRDHHLPAAGQADVAVPAAGGTATATSAASPPPLAAVAGLPLEVGSPAAGRLHVRVLDHAAAQRAGVSGFLFQVARADGGAGAAPVTARVDYSGFAQAFGGGYASRLTIVSLPACAATTPRLPACQVATPVPTANDVAAHTLTATVTTGPAVLATTTTASGGTGDFKATPLAPSATWQVGLQTGDFTWSYPFQAPPAIGGGTPGLALAYDSGATDGETAQSNSQTSQVGEGFQLAGGGFVERKYRSCADEISTVANKTGDLCWGGDNAFLAFDGHATELVKDDDSQTWHLKDDDGSRVELLTGASNGAHSGEYWKVTRTDGTQYFFGLNQLPGYASGDTTTSSVWTVPVVGRNAGEPCHGSDYASSVCDQAWRWNLDLVVDPDGNATSYLYAPETNHYLFDSTASSPGTARQYTRGGALQEVDYSQRASDVYAHTPMRIRLSYGDRCVSGSSCSTHTAQFWPDTPWDLSCSGGGCGASGHEAPSFWTQSMLTDVRTQVWEGSTAGWTTIDSWSLLHQFLSADTDDLWLKSITRTGQDGGSASLLPVTLDGTSSVNRVAGDGYSPMYKYRVTAIHSESGQQIAVTYGAANCGSSRPTPSTDTLPCFEQWWSPGDPQLDEAPVDSWFYKYPVASVRVHDETNVSTDDQVTSYVYPGGAAWHYDNDDGLVPNKYKSYSQWRGFGRVRVITGASNETQGETDHTFMRGMDGDHLPDGSTRSVSVTDSQGTSIPDSERLNGFEREHVLLDGPGGPEVSGSIADPWQSAATASSVKSWGTLTASLEGVAAGRDRTDLAAGGVRRTEVDNTFDDQGLITQTSDLGDLASGADQLCTANTYVRSTSAWILDTIDEQKVTAAACGSSGALVSDTRHLYDGGAFGAAPAHGDVTETDEWSAGDPGVADHWVATTRTVYDAYGRVTSSQDAAGSPTRTTFTSAYGSGNATTQTVVTNPLGFTTTTDLDPGRGLAVDTIDTNGGRTDMAYDPLGRLTAVWLPGQAKASRASPNETFAYQMTASAPAAVTTSRLVDAGTGAYVSDVALYDGLLRPRQTQRVAEAVDGTVLVTDTLYDSRGEVVTQNAPYAVGGAPSAAPIGVSQAQVPSYTVSTYDGAGRRTADALYSKGALQWQTTTSYGGDRATVTPPRGGTPTTTIVDARGRTTELDQYHGASATGAFDATRYTYTPAGQPATVTDPAGNLWTNTYDLLGRRTQAVDPDTGTAASTYDDLGRLTSATDARGRTTSTTYDALGRRTAEYDTTGGAAETASDQVAAWTYDTVAGAVGQPASATSYHKGDAYVEAVTGYDSAYRPTGTRITIPGTENALAGSYTFATTYTVDGRVATVSFPAAGGLPAETVTHTFDALGEPDSTVGASDYVERTLWTPDMLPATYDLGLGQNSSWSAVNMAYDPATRRLAEVTVQRESNGWADDADLVYGYDDTGNVTSASETVAGDYQCFAYDSLRRLTRAWAQAASGCATSPTTSTIGGPAPYLDQLGYDPTGNRTSETLTYAPGNSVSSTEGYPAAGSSQPHTLATRSVVSSASGSWTEARGYDAAGDTTSITTPTTSQSLTWNDQGKLAKVADSVGGHTTTYVYDADGSQLLRHDDGTATLYLPGEELTTSGAAVVATRYYSHNGATVAVRTAGGASGSVVDWLVADPHGTETIAIDASAQTVSQRRFLPFGTPRGVAPSWPTDRGLAGGTADATTGFTNLGAREYDPTTGRFLSADPVALAGDPQQMNGYAYAGNNPVTLADPTGLTRCDAGDCPSQCQVYHDCGGGSRGGGGCGACGGGSGPVPPPYTPLILLGPLALPFLILPPPPAPRPKPPPPHPRQVVFGGAGNCTLVGRAGLEQGCRPSMPAMSGGTVPGWLRAAGSFVGKAVTVDWNHSFWQASACLVACLSLTLQGGHLILSASDFSAFRVFDAKEFKPSAFLGVSAGMTTGTPRDEVHDNVAFGGSYADGVGGGAGASIFSGPRGDGPLHPYAEVTVGAGWNVHGGQSYSVDLNRAAPAWLDRTIIDPIRSAFNPLTYGW